MSKNRLIGTVGGYGHQKCCGCGACSMACPKHCLKMKEDKQGFLYPVFSDEKACVDCGICTHVCPVQQPFEKKGNIDSLAAFTDNVDRLSCSSGGINTLVAEHVIKEGGVVFGARFDSEWNVGMDCTDIRSELQKFSGSKYVQAYPGNAYKKVAEYLRQSRLVLFTGLPCQVAGLHRYLHKEYEQLITISCLCHSVPSPLAWKKYLASNSKKDKIRNFNFRDKSKGWENYSFKVAYDDGEEQVLTSKNIYMDAMLENLSTRPSCAVCKFKGGRSNADIELGDCWGSSKICPSLFDNKGMNVVLTYSLKGQQVLQQLPFVSKHIELKKVMRYNEGLKQSTPLHPHQKLFFHLLHFINFNDAAMLCLSTSFKAILKYLFFYRKS